MSISKFMVWILMRDYSAGSDFGIFRAECGIVGDRKSGKEPKKVF